MKTYNLLALAGCLWMTAACSDFLELDESQHHTVEYDCRSQLFYGALSC